jgi:hypothetical protein
MKLKNYLNLRLIKKIKYKTVLKVLNSTIRLISKIIVIKIIILVIMEIINIIFILNSTKNNKILNNNN